MQEFQEISYNSKNSKLVKFVLIITIVISLTAIAISMKNMSNSIDVLKTVQKIDNNKKVDLSKYDFETLLEILKEEVKRTTNKIHKNPKLLTNIFNLQTINYNLLKNNIKINRYNNGFKVILSNNEYIEVKVRFDGLYFYYFIDNDNKLNELINNKQLLKKYLITQIFNFSQEKNIKVKKINNNKIFFNNPMFNKLLLYLINKYNYKIVYKISNGKKNIKIVITNSDI